MAFFYRHNPKKFNYKPRYFDPEQQEWEEKKAAAGLDSKLTHEEQCAKVGAHPKTRKVRLKKMRNSFDALF